jgi:hypothetical protein
MGRRFALGSNGPLSGKTTLAKHLKSEYGFLYVSHSRTIVTGFVNMWNDGLPHKSGLSGVEQVTVEQVYADKESWRQQLQTYGYTMGYNDPGAARYWILRTLEPWLDDNRKQDVVFDAWRGEVQAQELRNLGFEIIQIDIDALERSNRAQAMGCSFEKVYESMLAEPKLECGLGWSWNTISPDTTLNGEMPVEILGKTLMHRPEKVRTGYTIFGQEVRNG